MGVLNMSLTDLSAVSQPIDQANGLPNAHYIDASVYGEERQSVLFDNWAGLAVAADVPQVGDAVPRPPRWRQQDQGLVFDLGGVNIYYDYEPHRLRLGADSASP